MTAKPETANQRRRELSAAWDAPLTVDGFNLHGFQRATVAYAQETRRCLIREPSGFEAATTAMAAAVAAEAFPILIVCPPAGAGSWLARSRTHLDDRAVTYFANPAKDLTAAQSADVIVVGYPALRKQVNTIAGFNPRAVIFDGSEALKDPKAQQAQGAKKLIRQLPASTMVIARPTRIVKPADLGTQLDIIEQIEPFGGLTAFRDKYCGPTRRGGAPGFVTFDGATNQREMYSRLRDTCFVSHSLDDLATPHPFMIDLPDDIRLDYQAREHNLLARLRIAIADCDPGDNYDAERVAHTFGAGTPPWVAAGFEDPDDWHAWNAIAHLIATHHPIIDEYLALRSFVEEHKVPAAAAWLREYLENTTDTYVAVATPGQTGHLVELLAEPDRVTVVTPTEVQHTGNNQPQIVYIVCPDRPEFCPLVEAGDFGPHLLVARDTIDAAWWASYQHLNQGEGGWFNALNVAAIATLIGVPLPPLPAS